MGPADVLHLQRTIGNQRTAALLGGTIQRLPTSDNIVSQAQAPKKNVSISLPFSDKSITLKEMSTAYKAVLTKVDAYHSELSNRTGLISPVTKDQVATRLKSLLGNVVQACSDYLLKHPNDDRSPTIIDLSRHAQEETRLIDQIAKNPSFEYRSWKDVVGELQIAVVGSIGLAKDVQNKAINKDSQFHGTSSGLLDNLKGEMMTGKELENRGIVPQSGEGDFYSRGGGGGKDFISTGEGLPGMGTAMAYAKTNILSPDYNPALFTDDDLLNQIAQLTRILVAWDENLNQVDKKDIMGARKEKTQFEGLYKKYKAEMDLRVKLPMTHPRRQGKPYSESTYPLMFEINSQGLNVVNPRPEITLRDDSEGGRALGGERAVKDQAIDLRVKGRLKRVFCPLDKVSAVQTKLSNILGHSAFSVVAFEMMPNLPEIVGDVEFRTLELMETQYAPMRRMVLHAYEEGMTTNQVVDGGKLTESGQELEIIKAVAKGARTLPEIIQSTGMHRDQNEFQRRLNNLMLKLGANSIDEIPAKAKQAGLLPDRW